MAEGCNVHRPPEIYLSTIKRVIFFIVQCEYYTHSISTKHFWISFPIAKCSKNFSLERKNPRCEYNPKYSAMYVILRECSLYVLKKGKGIMGGEREGKLYRKGKEK